MPFEQGMKKGGPPLQTPLLRFTTRSALAIDLICNLHKIYASGKSGLEKLASMVQNLTSHRRHEMPARDNFEEHGPSPNTSFDRSVPGTSVGRVVHPGGPNAMCRISHGFPPRHPIAGRVGSGLGNHLAGCTRSHGILAGQQFHGSPETLDSGLPLCRRMANLPGGQRASCKCAMVARSDVRHACMWLCALRLPSGARWLLVHPGCRRLA